MSIKRLSILTAIVLVASLAAPAVAGEGQSFIGDAGNATGDQAAVIVNVPAMNRYVPPVGRNYYYMKVAGPALAIYNGITEGNNFGWAFKEFFFDVYDESNNSGHYEAYGQYAVPSSGTQVIIHTYKVGFTAWECRVFRLDNGLDCARSRTFETGMQYFTKVGAHIGAEDLCNTSVIDGAHFKFESISYLPLGSTQFTPLTNAIQEVGRIYRHAPSRTGSLNNGGTLGLRLDAI